MVVFEQFLEFYLIDYALRDGFIKYDWFKFYAFVWQVSLFFGPSLHPHYQHMEFVLADQLEIHLFHLDLLNIGLAAFEAHRVQMQAGFSGLPLPPWNVGGVAEDEGRSIHEMVRISFLQVVIQEIDGFRVLLS